MRQAQKHLWPALTMGACYYPEQWDEALWQSDLQRMKQAGVSVIRVAEFAWNKFEPQEASSPSTSSTVSSTCACRRGCRSSFPPPQRPRPHG